MICLNCLKKYKSNIIFINDLQKFGLQTPVCIQNEQNILNFYLSEKWLNDFPKQSLILKLIEEEKKLFYLPELTDFYYLYYHLLRAFSNYLETGQKIYDDETQLNYDKLNDEMIEKQLNATKFFEIYLKKGSNFTEDFFLAKKDKDELDFASSEITSDEMVSQLSNFLLKEKTESDESVTVAGESEPELKEDDSQIEIEVEEVNLDDEVKFESFI